mmetsp:Transcript_39793/g.124318  ORF Transcript_39793/g.124318 Transcript_39793/m.124318 type:complete len:205 (+) Transcript_39793:1488-2102(+)
MSTSLMPCTRMASPVSYKLVSKTVPALNRKFQATPQSIMPAQKFQRFSPRRSTSVEMMKMPPPSVLTTYGPASCMSFPVKKPGENMQRKWHMSTMVDVVNLDWSPSVRSSSCIARVIGPMRISMVVCASVVIMIEMRMSGSVTIFHSDLRSSGAAAGTGPRLSTYSSSSPSSKAPSSFFFDASASEKSTCATATPLISTSRPMK